MAKKVVGKMHLRLGLDDKELEKGLKKNESRLSGFAASTKAGLAGVGTAVAAAMAAAGAAIVAAGALTTRQIASAIEKANQLDDVSKRIRASFADTAALDIAATLSGTNLEAITSAVARSTKSISDAAQGKSQPVADALKAIGLRAEELMKLPVSEQLGRIFDGLNGVENGNQRAALAMELFGKSAANLNDLISKGGENLEEARRKAELYGLTLDSVEVEGITAAGDAIDEMKMAWDGLWRQLAAKVAPVIALIGEKFREWIDDMGGVGKASEAVFGYIVLGAKIAARSVDYLTLAWRGVSLAIEAIELGIYGVISVSAKAAKALRDMAPDWLKNVQGAFDNYSPYSLIFGSDNGPSFDDKLDSVISSMEEKISESQKKLLKKTFDFSASWGRAIGGGGAEGVGKFVAAAQESVKKLAAETKAVVDDMGDVVDVGAEKTKKIATEFDKLNGKIKTTTAQLKSLDDIINKGGNSRNARFAKRAKGLSDRADEAEARGDFSRADRLRAQGKKWERKISRRPQTQVESYLREIEKMREQADKLDSQGKFADAEKLRRDALTREKAIEADVLRQRQSVYPDALTAESEKVAPAASARVKTETEQERGSGSVADLLRELVRLTKEWTLKMEAV